MSDIFPERLEPLTPVHATVSQQAGRDSGSDPRRRPPPPPSPPVADEIEVVESENDEPPHKVDRLA